MLISDPAARRARAAEKRAAVLSFLSAEVWSTPAVLARVVGHTGSLAGVYRLLATLEAEELVCRGEWRMPTGRPLAVWGITQTGRAMAEGVDPIGPTFEPRRLSLTAVPHQLLLQELRLRAEAAGWTDWTRGERLPRDAPIRPDALATRPDGLRVAIEAERTLKSARRYRVLILQHLQAMRRSEWAGVYYLAPPRIAAGLTRLFSAIDRLPGGLPWDSEARKRFRVLSSEDWPPLPASHIRA